MLDRIPERGDRSSQFGADARAGGGGGRWERELEKVECLLDADGGQALGEWLDDIEVPRLFVPELVPDEPQLEVDFRPRFVALHPWVDETGKGFILPQVLQRRLLDQSPWHLTLAEALGVPLGEWLTIWSPPDGNRVEYEFHEPPFTTTPEYPDFLWDSLEIVVASHISDPDHALRQLLQGMKK